MRFFEQSRVVPPKTCTLCVVVTAGQMRLICFHITSDDNLMLCQLHYYDQVTQPARLVALSVTKGRELPAPNISAPSLTYTTPTPPTQIR